MHLNLLPIRELVNLLIRSSQYINEKFGTLIVTRIVTALCIRFSNQGLNLLLEYLARVDKLEKYKDRIQIVIKRPY